MLEVRVNTPHGELSFRCASYGPDPIDPSRVRFDGVEGILWPTPEGGTFTPTAIGGVYPGQVIDYAEGTHTPPPAP